MARPDHRKAAKDYPANGISKGDMYWYVKIKTGPYSSRVMRQLTPFRASQLTSSSYLGPLYEWQEDKANLHDMDNASELADRIRDLGAEQRDKFDNMPEGLQQGDTGMMLEQRADACETAADEIEEIVSEWEDAKSTWESEIETYKAEYETYKLAQEAWDDWNGSEDEGADEPITEDEPDLPDNTCDNGDETYEFDDSDFISRVNEVDVSE